MLSALIPAMHFQSRLLFTSVFLAGGFLFAQPGFSQSPATTDALTENEDNADETGESRGESRRSTRVRQPMVTPDGTQLPDAESELSSGLITSFETQQLVVEGTAVEPIPYRRSPRSKGRGSTRVRRPRS